MSTGAPAPRPHTCVSIERSTACGNEAELFGVEHKETRPARHGHGARSSAERPERSIVAVVKMVASWKAAIPATPGGSHTQKKGHLRDTNPYVITGLEPGAAKNCHEGPGGP
jgi:hypothetical protein